MRRVLKAIKLGKKGVEHLEIPTEEEDDSLTIRDQIALNILPTLVQLSAHDRININETHHGMSHHEVVAEHAYKLADAVLAERRKKPLTPEKYNG